MASKTRDRIRAAAKAAREAAGDDAAAKAQDEVTDPGSTEPETAEPTGEIPDKLYFRIGEVARLVGVDAHVLRYWESEFNMKPHRSSSGQRLYRKQDLARFLRIKHLLHDEGYTIAGARRVLSDGGKTNTMDPERLKEALARVEQLRFAIQDFREEIAPS